MTDVQPIDRFMRLPEVKESCGLSSSTIYRHIAAGTFPRPVRITEGAVAWYESEIVTWQQSRPRAATVGGNEKTTADRVYR